jgi:hypothetical protein
MLMTPRHGRWLAGNLKAGAGIASLPAGYIRLKRELELSGSSEKRIFVKL